MQYLYNHPARSAAHGIVLCLVAVSAAPVLAQAVPAAQPEIAAPAAEMAAAVPATVLVSGHALRDGQRSGKLGTGTDGSSMDVPFSVDSVAGTRIRDQAGTSLQDALRNIPGAQADSGFNGAHAQSFILRGAVADSGTGANRILRDGVRLSNYPYVPAFIESLDVLRGPGSALGVRSEPGGTVDLVTRQPNLKKNSGAVLAAAGEHGARELTVDLNRVLSADDALAARIIATRSEASAWRHVPDTLDAVKLGIAKADGRRYRLSAGFEAIEQAYRPDYGIPAMDGRPVAVPSDRQFGEPFGDSTTKNRIVDLHADIALGDEARLAVDATHLEAHATAIKNMLNGAAPSGQPVGTFVRATTWEPNSVRRIDALAASLTGTHMFFGQSHQLFVGLDKYREMLDQPTLNVPASASPDINVFDPIYGRGTAPAPGVPLARAMTTERLASVAASVQDQVELDGWAVVAGVRYTHQEFVYGAPRTLPANESRWSPKLGLLYRVSGQHTWYTNVVSGISPNQVASSSNQSLPSRTARQTEVGWKSRWLDGKLMGDVALFRLAQANLASADESTPANRYDFTLDGAARSQGLEGSLTGTVGARIDIAATYAYTDAAYTRNALYGGKRVPNVARHATTLWAQYRWSDAWKSGAGLYVQSARFADETNGTTLPGYGRLDATQTWSKKIGAGQSVELQLALRNAFDQHYFVSSHLHVARWITPGEGRNLSITATCRF